MARFDETANSRAPRRATVVRGRLNRVTAAAVWIGAVLFSAAGLAQNATDPLAERSQFFGSVDVSIVNLDVMVTDRDGRPVTGLQQEDFELLVDGEPVEIANFFAASDTLGAVDLGHGAEAPVPLPLPSSQRLWLVVYLDSSSIRGPDRNRVIGQLRQLLDANLGQEDRVMVVTQGTSQEIRHRFDDPVEELPAVLDEVADEIGGMGQYESARLTILNNLRRGAAGRIEQDTGQTLGSLRQDTRLIEAETALGDIRSWVQWRRDGFRVAASRMEALLDALAGVEGRKAMVYVGEGTPYRIGQSLFQAWIDHYQPMVASMLRPPQELLTLNAYREANRYSVQRDYLRLAQHAAAARVAFYAIDASQSVVAAGVSAEIPGSTNSYASETDRAMAQQESLLRLVDTTGGRYIADLDRVDDVVQGLRDDFTSYYSLGFAPPGQADDEARDVEVRVRDPELSVRHRSSFRAKTLDESMAEQLYAALYLDVAPNPLAVALEAVKTEVVDGDRYKVTLLARIPLSSLLLVPQADELLGRATAWLAVANETGGMSDVHGRRMPIRVDKEQLAQAAGQDVGYTLQVMVGPGRQNVALVIRDELAVVSSTVTLALDDGHRVDTVVRLQEPG